MLQTKAEAPKGTARQRQDRSASQAPASGAVQALQRAADASVNGRRLAALKAMVPVVQRKSRQGVLDEWQARNGLYASEEFRENHLGDPNDAFQAAHKHERRWHPSRRNTVAASATIEQATKAVAHWPEGNFNGRTTFDPVVNLASLTTVARNADPIHASAEPRNVAIDETKVAVDDSFNLTRAPGELDDIQPEFVTARGAFLNSVAYIGVIWPGIEQYEAKNRSHPNQKQSLRRKKRIVDQSLAEFIPLLQNSVAAANQNTELAWIQQNFERIGDTAINAATTFAQVAGTGAANQNLRISIDKNKGQAVHMQTP